jgi:hypothetical protein
MMAERKRPGRVAKELLCTKLPSGKIAKQAQFLRSKFHPLL